MNLESPGAVPWLDKMRRLNTEWMAPENVVSLVSVHYLEAFEWMQTAALNSSARMMAMASRFLRGAYWRRFFEFAEEQRRAPRPIGVLRADHRVEVRYFTSSGAGCHVIDYQGGRRMATYSPLNHERITTQDLGSGSLVYFMRYDSHDRRWKIEAFIQELPPGWAKAPHDLQRFGGFHQPIGRDN
jgi:hypothetical protein